MEAFTTCRALCWVLSMHLLFLLLTIFRQFSISYFIEIFMIIAMVYLIMLFLKGII